GTDYEQANLLAVAAIFRHAAGKAVDGIELAEASVRLARRIGNPSQLAISLAALGMVLAAHDPPSATAPLEESLALTAAGASDVLWSMCLSALSAARAAFGDRRGALECVRDAIRHGLMQSDGPSIAYALAEGLAPLVDVVRTELIVVSRCLFDAQGWW